MAEEFRRRLSGEVDRVQYEFRGRHKNGGVIDIECHGSCMDINGRPALISLLIDVTERTRVWREIQELQVRLREQALHDPLTGLYNRQSLNELVNREIRLAERRRYPISMVMCDLDHFKAINDNYGHLVGDEVLRVVSELVKRSYRASDIYFRYGGEEFLIVLPGMTDVAAVERTEQLRFAVRETPVVIGSAAVNITASFGVATFPQHGMTCDALIAAADRAMYAAKNAGRNRVISASDELEAEVFSEAPERELQAVS
jgi:diguanylate cyclase (GGDEF)-like protein